MKKRKEKKKITKKTKSTYTRLISRSIFNHCDVMHLVIQLLTIGILYRHNVWYSEQFKIDLPFS